MRQELKMFWDMDVHVADGGPATVDGKPGPRPVSAHRLCVHQHASGQIFRERG